MTATLTEPPVAARRRPRRSTWLLLGGLIAAVVVTIVVGAADSRQWAALDPDNPDPSGARAVARVLADQGVEVTMARDADALERASPDADTTVVVTSADLLGQSTTDRLLGTDAGTLVVVEPGPGTVEALGLTIGQHASRPDDPVAAECSEPTYAGLEVAVDGAVEYDGSGCFPGAHGTLLAEPRSDLILLGAGDLLSNDQILRADNAAVALRLLGQHSRLVWYVPSLDDLSADDGVSLQTLLPPWLRPALWLVAIAALALLLWRARRLGPLAVEPLPVVVRATETTRSRGRLYRKAGDRAHAAAVLREGARAQAAERLGLGRHVAPEALVRDLARHTGRPVDEIDRLLGSHAPAPGTDHDLIMLADRLAELDREVRRP